MTSDSPFDGDVESQTDFDSALRELLSAALDNGIDPRGSWEYRTNGFPSDWEVMVVELEARD